MVDGLTCEVIGIEIINVTNKDETMCALEAVGMSRRHGTI